MYRGPSFGHHPVGGFYPSLAGIFPAQLCPPKNIVFSLRLRAVTLNVSLKRPTIYFFRATMKTSLIKQVSW